MMIGVTPNKELLTLRCRCMNQRSSGVERRALCVRRRRRRPPPPQNSNVAVMTDDAKGLHDKQHRGGSKNNLRYVNS